MASDPAVCELTDLLRSACAHCRGIPDLPAARREPDPEAPPHLGPWFAALYDGLCMDCKAPIEPGDTIRSSGRGGYLCGECGYAWENLSA